MTRTPHGTRRPRPRRRAGSKDLASWWVVGGLDDVDVLITVKHLVLAYDGASPARHALERAAELARPGDLVSVVNVMPDPGVSARVKPPSEQRNRQWRMLDEAQQLLAGRGIESRRVAAVGNVAREILGAAERAEADVIVVARHRGRVLHARRSVSWRIIRGASCDVLVVHDAPAEGGLHSPPLGVD
jgi:nucleotide-binding universal stress UspA family protein